ncbi:nicotinate-nucleotide adenylyltransferase [Candidatus Manganitrophus noduliformans]|uniref:Probable nicotinate-nucleotide adenylyltransferase n=1 Tax=Candidatus Manganitrophus noduliformans TaxID=2606439 RepID=A0A7X6I9P6_9BACT|nr:nicotinate-nucleotide adenylyltransferase [Candidatus Manganitrophus noduliformans]NKE69698.1 nicotinate-nucleotide adenylyltransferase [Candidatus Manganitrophus noduliformans]
MRIGLLGGTFNPIHNGHLYIAGAVREKLHLDRILFIPSGTPPHKEEEGIPPAKHRLEMTRLALLGHPEFELCEIEVKRPGKSYSVETLSELKRLHPHDRLFFIIGTDAFVDLPTWREPERLFTLSDFIVVTRPGHPFSQLPDLGPLQKLKRSNSSPLLELDRRKEGIVTVPLTSETSIHFLSISPSPISASEIRKRLAAGRGTKNLLPEPVASYIIKNKLYGASSETFRDRSDQERG